MPETTVQDAPESDLVAGADASAPQMGADPVAYWQVLTLDPTFILTGTTAPSREAALEDLLTTVKTAADQTSGAPIVLAEGWPAITGDPPTQSDLAIWKKKIEVYHAQYLSLAAAVQDAFPALVIQTFPLASELATLLDAPVLAEVTITDLFTPDATLGTPALSALSAVLTGSALSDAPLPDVADAQDALPKVLAENYAEIIKLAHLAVGAALSDTGGENANDGGTPAPAEPTPPVEPTPVTNFIGTDADDLIDLTADLAQIDGGGGTDTVAVAALSDTATITFDNGNLVQLTLAEDDPLVLENIERIAFEDRVLAFDDDGLAGQAYRLYQACFDRTPDTEGLGFWIKQLDAGRVTLNQAADFFIGSEEFAEIYGSPETLADVHYLALLYANVLDRVPDAQGFGFWRDQQEDGVTRADMLVYFSESTENVARVATAIDDGIWYV